MAVSSASNALSPGEEYGRRERGGVEGAARLERVHARLGYARLLAGVALLALAWFSIVERWVSPSWMLVPAAVFAGLAVYQAEVSRRRRHALRVAEVYRLGLARVEDRWIGRREREDRAKAEGSLYAADLDVFGRGGLFELLCGARTRMGEDTLAGWLLAPAAVSTIRERHAAIAELREQLQLREDMATCGEEVRVGVHPEALLPWAEGDDPLPQHWVRWIALALALLAVGAAVRMVLAGGAAPLAALIAVQWILHRALRNRVREVLGETGRALDDMRLMSSLLERMEAETFQAARLREVQGRLSAGHVRASVAIRMLAARVAYLDSLRNPLMRMLDVPLLYSVQLAFAVQAWRGRYGREVRAWLESLGEMEALLSLAVYSYEHPADPFPEFLEGQPSFAADELGHPLISKAQCVRNGIRLGGEVRVLVISGSNMSGKSTLMRAVGLNTVLAMAGAPVRAARLRLTPLEVGASILVNDSLQEGRSRFYAEITRLRAICDLAEARPPVLFLLDELLQGTNSRDRLAGARGIVRALVETGSIGLISTHDLAITELGEGGDGRLRNQHFEDRIEDGVMRFDFRLREGVVTRSNGVELMRMVGLKV